MDFRNKSVGHLAAPRQPEGVHTYQLHTVCVWSFMYNSKTFGNQLSICSQVALNPGRWCRVLQIIAVFASFSSSPGLFHSNGTLQKVWEQKPGCRRFQGGSGFFYYQVQRIQTHLWTVNTPRGLRVIVKVGAKLGTQKHTLKHTLKHRKWSPLRISLRRCQCFG